MIFPLLKGAIGTTGKAGFSLLGNPAGRVFLGSTLGAIYGGARGNEQSLETNIGHGMLGALAGGLAGAGISRTGLRGMGWLAKRGGLSGVALGGGMAGMTYKGLGMAMAYPRASMMLGGGILGYSMLGRNRGPATTSPNISMQDPNLMSAASQKRLQNSTMGLVQGMHRGRHR